MSWTDLSERWKNHFTEILHSTASMSRDENTKVGALIIDTKNKVVVSSGWNDLPRGVLEKVGRNSRPDKYFYTSHAEVSCLTNALRLNTIVSGHTMLVTLGCCPQCTCSVINSGIKEVVTPNLDYSHSSCGEVYKHSEVMMKEAGVLWLFDKNLEVL